MDLFLLRPSQAVPTPPTQGKVSPHLPVDWLNKMYSVMLGAGLLAKRAVEMGLKVAPYIKTSLRYWQEQGLPHITTDFYLFSPGSGVVRYYLEESGVIPYLEALGFGVVGYCIIIDLLYTVYTHLQCRFFILQILRFDPGTLQVRLHDLYWKLWSPS